MITSRRRGAIVTLAVLTPLSALAACGDDADDEAQPAPVIDQIPDAVAAVEAELGHPARFIEINANAQLVNLFVAADDPDSDAAADVTVTAYVYVGGELGPAKDLGPGQGDTFAAADIEDLDDLDADVIEQVQDELPDSPVTVFVIGPYPGGNAPAATRTLRYSALIPSDDGENAVEAVIDRSGTVLEAGPA